MNQRGVRYNLYSMFYTPLLEALRAQSGPDSNSVRESDYRGATTVTRFSGSQEEFSAMENGCGIYDLGYRFRVSLKGGDRVRWMNGMVTNNTRDLAVGRGVYAFLLNPQGRILADMNAYNFGETLAVVTDRSQLEKVLATFDHYIIMDDVEVVNEGERWTALGLVGPKSREILKAAGITVPELQPMQTHTAQCDCDCDCLECTVVRGEEELGESYELWLAPKDVFKTWNALLAAGAVAVGSEAVEMRRIVAGIPLYGVDIRERDLPQETEQERALNFNKGCYVGQEIVERIRSRGNVHRKFTGFVVGGGATIEAGAKITSGDKEVGEVTSSVTVHTEAGERTLALGYIRREVGVPGRELTIGGQSATVTQPPFHVTGEAQAQEHALQQK
jgi:folate-binding protein YgfZ